MLRLPHSLRLCDLVPLELAHTKAFHEERFGMIRKTHAYKHDWDREEQWPALGQCIPWTWDDIEKNKHKLGMVWERK